VENERYNCSVSLFPHQEGLGLCEVNMTHDAAEEISPRNTRYRRSRVAWSLCMSSHNACEWKFSSPVRYVRMDVITQRAREQFQNLH